MNEKFYLSLHTQEPTHRESEGVTKGEYARIEWAGSDKAYTFKPMTFKGLFDGPDAGATILGFAVSVPVPSWRHPIKHRRAIKWNRQHGGFQSLKGE